MKNPASHLLSEFRQSYRPICEANLKCKLRYGHFLWIFWGSKLKFAEYMQFYINYWIILVSFENIDISPNYERMLIPIYGQILADWKNTDVRHNLTYKRINEIRNLLTKIYSKLKYILLKFREKLYH